jgi:hypothetical protein
MATKDELEAQAAALREKAKQKRKYLEAEPRSVQMTNQGWSNWRRVAKKRRIPVSAILELEGERLAQKELNEAERKEAAEWADELRERRQSELDQIESQLAELEKQLQAL